MIRFIAIMTLMLSGLPGLGGRLAAVGVPGAPVAADCSPVEVATSCCGAEAEPAYCPMSDGPCTCAVAPVPEPLPTPDAPRPVPGRDSLTAVPVSPVSVVNLSETTPEPTVGVPLTLGLLAGLSHNQIQALLGNWRT